MKYENKKMCGLSCASSLSTWRRCCACCSRSASDARPSRKYSRIRPFPFTTFSPRCSVSYSSQISAWVASDMVIQPGAEYEHMRAAVLTASPHRSYWNRLCPMMPAMAAPEWMPI